MQRKDPSRFIKLELLVIQSLRSRSLDRILYLYSSKMNIAHSISIYTMLQLAYKTSFEKALIKAIDFCTAQRKESTDNSWSIPRRILFRVSSRGILWPETTDRIHRFRWGVVIHGRLVNIWGGPRYKSLEIAMHSDRTDRKRSLEPLSNESSRSSEVECAPPRCIMQPVGVSWRPSCYTFASPSSSKISARYSLFAGNDSFFFLFFFFPENRTIESSRSSYTR